MAASPLPDDHGGHAAAFDHAFWFDVVPRSIACPGLPPQVLLHAGPPYRGSPPAAVLNAAVQAVLYERLAADETAARTMIASGDVRLAPAQDHGVATPLAQVVSASMPLLAVRQHGVTFYAPVVEGPAPALRFGCADARCRDALSVFGAWVIDTVAPLVRRQPVDIAGVIRAALANGDECHARTGAANEALLAQIDGLDAEDLGRLRANPAFVLTVIMAGAGAALRSHRCHIEAVGGNGIEFGVRHRGETQWRQIAAEAPRGTRFPAHGETAALPAIGDSAVIDICGLGGQALDMAPLLAAEWAHLLPEDAKVRRTALLDPASGIVNPARVVQSRIAPLVNLAILDRAGREGLIGRGFYAAPGRLFDPLPSPGK
nr:DUF1116 domain-containing protein [uncultured Noviherbaspirillum sp.]